MRVERLGGCRGNGLGVEGWGVLSDGLEGVTSLESLNGCDAYGAIRKGGVTEMRLRRTELWVWATRFLGRSSESLTLLDVR